MVIYADLLREASELPVVEAGGKTFTGRILSHEQFLYHEEALYLTTHDDDEDNAFASLNSQLVLAREFLGDVFEQPPLPERPEEPRAHSLLEKFWYWITGNDPKRFHEYVSALGMWEKEVKEADKNNPVKVILAHPNLWQIVAELFTSQRAALMGQAVTNTKKNPPVLDSSKNQSE